ncbi:MAG: c-type cytochrome [Paracoccus sp.]|nr:c-type cytochrome [Paracoccus sp. (in: a-proteobacteria)]
MPHSLGHALAATLLLSLPAFAQDTSDVPPVPEEMASLTADTEAGQALYRKACAQCHGRSAGGTAVFPALEAQTPEYLVSRLLDYRAGEAEGPNAALMMPVARDLTDQQIVDVANFLAQTYP